MCVQIVRNKDDDDDKHKSPAPNGYSLLVVGVPQSGGLFGGTLCKLYPPTPPLRRPGLPVFWGSQPCVPKHFKAATFVSLKIRSANLTFCLSMECGCNAFHDNQCHMLV